MKETKSKKCDYCDEYATLKFREHDLYTYVCEWCYNNLDEAKHNF